MAKSRKHKQAGGKTVKEPPRDQLNVLLGIYHSGDMNSTERACRELLRSFPKSLNILNILGLALAMQGNRKLQEAVQVFRKTITLKPDFAIGYCNLGNALSELGQTEAAITNFRKATRLQPGYAEAYYNCGNALSTLGRLDEAVESYSKAIEHRPDHAQAYCNRGNAFTGLGLLLEARDSYEQAIELRPDYAEAYSNLVGALIGLEQYAEALSCSESAISLNPDYAEAYVNRGVCLQELGRFDEAIASHRKAIRLKPDYDEAFSNLCEIYEKQNKLDELDNTLQLARQSLAEDNPFLLFRLGYLASREKRHEDARDYLQRVNLNQLPHQAQQGCSELLAKTYDKLGEYANAFKQFSVTNDLASLTYDARRCNGQRYLDLVSNLSMSWTHATEIAWPVTDLPASSHTLVFLVGFPRSGTTLLDTILRSHNEVGVVEEKPMVQAMLKDLDSLATPELLSSLDSRQISALRNSYYQQLHSYVPTENKYRIIIDKYPLNIIHAGLIKRVFPDAKFILALRHPCDCVLSCFIQNFKLNDAMANFLTLQSSAALYDAVMKLWLSYNAALAFEVGTIKYEDLVHDLQGTIEPLLNFIGVDWHDDLLEYQKTALSRERIHTPSYNQVTQRLYTQAVNRWKNYENEINDILPLLAPWAERFGYSS